jgi:hypothetical protein
VFRNHSTTGLLAILQAGSTLAENWLRSVYGIDKYSLSATSLRPLHGIMPGLAATRKQQLVSAVAMLFYFHILFGI